MLVCAFSWEQRKVGELTVESSEYTTLEAGFPLLTSSRNGLMYQNEYRGKQTTDSTETMFSIVPLGACTYRHMSDDDVFHLNVNRLEKGLVSREYPVFYASDDNNLDFIVQQINSSAEFRSFCAEQKKGGTRTRLYYKNLCEFQMLIPNTEEQEKIATFLLTLDTLITLHQRECFSFDFGSRSAKVAQKTISWEQRKLGEISESFEYGLNAAATEYDGKHKYIRITDIDDSTHLFIQDNLTSPDIDFSTADDYLLQAGDVLFARTGASVGKTYIYRSSDGDLYFAGFLIRAKIKRDYDADFVFQNTLTDNYDSYIRITSQRSGQPGVNAQEYANFALSVPCLAEQKKIGAYFTNLDNLITLHQREPPKEDKILNDIKTDTLFHEYYCQWLVIYKEGSVRGVTMQKYHLTAEWVKKLIPDVKLCDFDRITYQQLINDYAETHERQTTMDFHHQLKGAILDAVDDGLIARDPTRKVIIKGKSPNDKKKKYLSRYELQKLLTSLDLNSGLNMDWLILLIAKTGMRFSEAIAVTPMDFDFTHQTLSVNKTWDYKGEGGFQPTKNKSSVRKIRLDWQTVGQFYAIVRELNDTAPIFVSKEKKIYNSTLNDVLERHCKAVGIPTISVHGLRHTHASLLLFDGVSIASVAQRLGHSSINTTQKTYLHIIRELENKDIDLIMKSISSLLD